MLSLLALAAALTPTADAAAYYFNGAGLRGMARGGAFVAGVDDLSAQYYNPGALVRLERPQAYVNMSLVWQSVSFTRTDYNDDGTVRRQFDEVNNEAGAMPIPQFSVGHHFGLPNTYFALGLHPPFAPQLDYPERGAQRYALQDSLVLQWYAGPSVAHRVLPWLTIGAGAYWSPVNASQTIELMVCRDEVADSNTTRCATDFSDGTPMASVYNAYDTAAGREDAYAVESDGTVGVNMWDWNNITWNAGVLIEPLDWMDIGVSVQPALKVSGKGSLDIAFSDQHWLVGGADTFTLDPLISGTNHSDKDVTVNLTLPWVIRSGVAVRPLDILELEATAVYQKWDVTTDITVTDVNAVIARNPDQDVLTEDLEITDDVVLPANYVNTWTFALGGDLDVTDFLVARFGGYYEQSAVPPATQTVAVVDGEKIGYGLGLTGFLGKRWALEGAMSQTFIFERDIKNSVAARQEIPVDLLSAINGDISAELGPGGVVGNGLFSSRMFYLSAGVTHYWGKKNTNL